MYLPSVLTSSISQLTKSDFCFLIFLGNCCFIQDLAHWSTIGLGKECRGLYLLQDLPSHTTLVVHTGHSSSSNLWHSHLGHPSYSKLALLNKLVLSNVSNKSRCYDVCYFSKQKYFFFHLVLIFLKILLNLYIAISGVPPLLVLLKVSNIFLTLADDYSRYSCFICLNINLIHRS